MWNRERRCRSGEHFVPESSPTHIVNNSAILGAEICRGHANQGNGMETGFGGKAFEGPAVQTRAEEMVLQAKKDLADMMEKRDRKAHEALLEFLEKMDEMEKMGKTAKSRLWLSMLIPAPLPLDD